MLIEQLLLKLPECFIYKVPPLKTASGHRAEEWSLDSPIFTGCIKIYQVDEKLLVRVYNFKDPLSKSLDDEKLLLFEIHGNESITPFIDGVIDSSRYFVLRIVDPKTLKTALLGVGFRERESAFDFKSCLNEYIKAVGRAEEALVRSSQGNKLSLKTGIDSNTNDEELDDVSDDRQEGEIQEKQTHSPTATAVSSHTNLAIPAGNKIKLKLSLHHSSSSSAAAAATASSSKPNASKAVSRSILVSSAASKGILSPGEKEVLPTRASAPAASNDDDEEDGWGGFEGAPASDQVPLDI